MQCRNSAPRSCNRPPDSAAAVSPRAQPRRPPAPRRPPHPAPRPPHLPDDDDRHSLAHRRRRVRHLPLSRGTMLPAVRLLDEMDEQMWTLLQRNLAGISEAEADWRPHEAANNVRWMVGHLAWFEEWAHDALREEGRFLVDRDPTAYLESTIPELLDRFTAARSRYRARIA